MKHMHLDDPTQRVSHETIYTALYVLPRGELRRELIACLRQSRASRRPRANPPNSKDAAIRPQPGNNGSVRDTTTRRAASAGPA